jgi:hypothetical protein
VLIGLALAGLLVGVYFGSYILRSLIVATTPPATGPGSGGGTTPPPSGTTPPPTGGGGTTPGPALTTATLKVASRTYHTVQVGAFSDSAAATNAARQASAKGLAAYVWEPGLSGADKLWRVRTAIVPSRAAADRMLLQARSGGYPDAFINTFTSSPMDLAIQSTSGAYLRGFQDAVTGLAALGAAMDAAWDAYATGGPAALASHQAGVNAAANRVRQALAGLDAPAELRERHNVLLGVVNMADAVALEMAGVPAGGQARFQRAMSEFMGFVATFSRICASWR